MAYPGRGGKWQRLHAKIMEFCNLCTVWGKIIQHVDEFSKFYISRLHTITKYGPHINNSMKGLNI